MDKTQNPALLFAGGAAMDQSTAIEALRTVFTEQNAAKAAYIGTANGDNEGFYLRMSALLRSAGADEIKLVKLAHEDADIGTAKAVLSRADVIFISGGEVEDGMEWLSLHGLTGYLKELYNDGKHFVGMSAGTIMMGEHWVRWDDPNDESSARLFSCLGLVPFTFDTHAEDEDWIELKTALRLLGDGARGYGIPRGGIVKADSSGMINSAMGSCLTFVNTGGVISEL